MFCLSRPPLSGDRAGTERGPGRRTHSHEANRGVSCWIRRRSRATSCQEQNEQLARSNRSAGAGDRGNAERRRPLPGPVLLCQPCRGHPLLVRKSNLPESALSERLVRRAMRGVNTELDTSCNGRRTLAWRVASKPARRHQGCRSPTAFRNQIGVLHPLALPVVCPRLSATCPKRARACAVAVLGSGLGASSQHPEGGSPT